MAEIEIRGMAEFEAKLRLMSASARTQIAEDAVTEGAAVVQAYAQMNARDVFSRRQRGTLRNSIIPRVNKTATGAEAEIGPQVIYGRIQELGGTIRPIRGKVLHFKIDDRDIYTKQVTLPPRPYLAPAVNDHKDQIREVMQSAVIDGLSEFAV
ncbi:MAG: HK97 gp10 family phage protein [Clostridia bacterium]|nr:HK97 gp10 family phage protein [Clostridia bacterium]